MWKEERVHQDTTPARRLWSDGSHVPHFAAAAIRRVSRSSRPFWSSSTVDDHREMSSSACRQQSYYYQLHSLLRSMIRRSPFQNAARKRTAAINVCLMNPRSKGLVSVVRHGNNDDDDTPTERRFGNERDSRPFQMHSHCTYATRDRRRHD